MTVGSNSPGRIANRHVEIAHHIVNDKNQGGEHTNRLERVGPNQCLDASPTRVKPYQQHHAHHGDGKRNTVWMEHKPLEDDADHIETHSSTRHL